MGEGMVWEAKAAVDVRAEEVRAVWEVMVGEPTEATAVRATRIARIITEFLNEFPETLAFSLTSTGIFPLSFPSTFSPPVVDFRCLRTLPLLVGTDSLCFFLAINSNEYCTLRNCP